MDFKCWLFWHWKRHIHWLKIGFVLISRLADFHFLLSALYYLIKADICNDICHLLSCSAPTGSNTTSTMLSKRLTSAFQILGSACCSQGSDLFTDNSTASCTVLWNNQNTCENATITCKYDGFINLKFFLNWWTKFIHFHYVFLK